MSGRPFDLEVLVETFVKWVVGERSLQMILYSGQCSMLHARHHRGSLGTDMQGPAGASAGGNVKRDRAMAWLREVMVDGGG